jgi:hypothetical protein
MKTTTRRAVTLLAAGALGLGGLAVTVPALAGAGPLARPTAPGTPSPGWHGGMMGDGTGLGGMMGDGTGPGGMMGGSGGGMMAGGGGMMAGGGCAGLAVTAAKGTLTEAQQTTLVSMAQREKLAQDLYTAFAGKYDAVIFDHLAAGAGRHLTAIRTLLQRYGLTDPTAGRPAGQFSDPAVRATYTTLLARGQAGQEAALGVGQQVERTAIADLQAALTGLTAPDAKQVYTHLLAASQRHLTMVSRWSTR